APRSAIRDAFIPASTFQPASFQRTLDKRAARRTSGGRPRRGKRSESSGDFQSARRRWTPAFAGVTAWGCAVASGSCLRLVTAQRGTEQRLQLIAHPLRLALQPLVVGQQLLGIETDLLRRVRVLLVEVPVSCLDRVDVDFPCERVLHAAGVVVGRVAPPGLFHVEFLDADRLGLVVVLYAGRVLMLVVPDVPGGLALG